MKEPALLGTINHLSANQERSQELVPIGITSLRVIFSPLALISRGNEAGEGRASPSLLPWNRDGLAQNPREPKFQRGEQEPTGGVGMSSGERGQDGDTELSPARVARPGTAPFPRGILGKGGLGCPSLALGKKLPFLRREADFRFRILDF